MTSLRFLYLRVPMLSIKFTVLLDLHFLTEQVQSLDETALDKCLFFNYAFYHFCRKFRLLYDSFGHNPEHIEQALIIACQVGAKEIVQILLQDTDDIACKWVRYRHIWKLHLAAMNVYSNFIWFLDIDVVVIRKMHHHILKVTFKRR